MRHWGFWEWVAYGCLFVGALIMAAETGFKTEPEVMNHLPDFFRSSLWGFSPAALVICATIIPVVREFIYRNPYALSSATIPRGAQAVAPISERDSLPATLSIEFGEDKNYIREEHLTNGMLRKSIYVAVCNNKGGATAYDCNIKLIASTPVLKTGAEPTKYPVFFGANFNLVAKERTFVKVLSFAENGATNALERDNILISAAVGGLFGGWPTISPFPTKDNPGILTLEAFAPATVPSQARLKVWIDETVNIPRQSRGL
jgi:hypothetical protein